MKLIIVFFNILLILQCFSTYSQEDNSKLISKTQQDILFNFIQNDTNFNDKVVVYPYLGTTTFRDFNDDAADLVKLGFNANDLLSEDTTQYMVEKNGQSQIVINVDTIVKYERLSDSILEALESNKKTISYNNMQIDIENINMFTLSGFVSNI